MKETTKKTLKRIIDIATTILTAVVAALTTMLCMSKGPFIVREGCVST